MSVDVELEGTDSEQEPAFDPKLTPAEEKLASQRWTNEGPVEEPEDDDTNADDETVETPKPEKPDYKPPVDEFDHDTLLKANAYGISPEEAKEFGSKAALNRAMALIDRRFAEQQQRQMPQQQQQAPTAKETAAEAKRRLLDPAGFDPALVSAFDAQEKEIAELKAWRDQQVQREQFSQQQAAYEANQKFYNDLDSSVVNLKDEELFGKGSMFDQPQNSSTRANREKLAAAVELLRDGYAKRGLQVPELGDLIQRARRLEFGDVLEKRIKQETNQRITAHSKKRLGTPERSRNINGKFSGDVKDDPELKKMYDDMLAENGSK